MSRQDANAPPKSGFAVLKPELHVNDLEQSVSFWVDMLGFNIAYRREEEKFVYLEASNGAQLMLCQRNGKWETGPMQKPLGQGMMLQIEVSDLAGIERTLQEQGWPIHTGPREVWRRTGDCQNGQRELFVQDPDGYLLMLEEPLGLRELPT